MKREEILNLWGKNAFWHSIFVQVQDNGASPTLPLDAALACIVPLLTFGTRDYLSYCLNP